MVNSHYIGSTLFHTNRVLFFSIFDFLCRPPQPPPFLFSAVSGGRPFFCGEDPGPPGAPAGLAAGQDGGRLHGGQAAC